MICEHAKISIPLPNLNSVFYKEECTLCFDTQDYDEGLDVCLNCYNGSCPREHSMLHSKKAAHPIVLNIKRIETGKRPEKITKLQINEDQKEYKIEMKLYCIACNRLELDQSLFEDVVNAVLNGISAKKKADLKAWEEESLQKCFHTDELVQDGEKVAGRDLAHCKDCQLNENLWLCLACGNLGCGRAQYGGLGGNGHGLAHYEATKHPVAVKMGSITPEGNADVFCYEHGSEIFNPKLAEHLEYFGINILQQEKTEKSIAEMQLEQNLKFDFSMKTADGEDMQPLFGPGHTGIRNLGNSCYLASVFQVLFSVPSVSSYYKDGFNSHLEYCPEHPAECFKCQMGKFANGLLSGRYSCPPKNDREIYGIGILPSMLKDVVALGNAEFQSMRQQDAQEFFQYVLSLIQQKERINGADPSHDFQFKLENKLQCQDCRRVQYNSETTSCLVLQVPKIKVGVNERNKPIYRDANFSDMLDMHFQPESREYTCPVDKKPSTAIWYFIVNSSIRFQLFPEILSFNAARFVLGDGWVIEKLNIDINVPEVLSLDNVRAKGLQPGEEEFPADVSTNQGSNSNSVDEGALAQLQSMGFPETRCRKALLQTGNLGADVAMNWLFEHMDDPDIDAPIGLGTGNVESAGLADIASLMDMGFTENQAKKALRETNNNMERAVDWLFSHPDVPDEPETSNDSDMAIDTGPAKYELFALISHKGTSAQCGHYVAFVKKDGDWVLYNDEKVVKVPNISDATKGAYLYFYRRL